MAHSLGCICLWRGLLRGGNPPWIFGGGGWGGAAPKGWIKRRKGETCWGFGRSAVLFSVLLFSMLPNPPKHKQAPPWEPLDTPARLYPPPWSVYPERRVKVPSPRSGRSSSAFLGCCSAPVPCFLHTLLAKFAISLHRYFASHWNFQLTY